MILLVIASLIPVLFQSVMNDKPLVPTSTETTSPVMTGQQEDELTPEPSAGLVVSGRVTDLAGAGVENVSIYRSYASYTGEVIATTDANGDYVSMFYPIPGDENVTIRAEKPGITFEPEYCHWRHYYGYEQAECNFQIKGP